MYYKQLKDFFRQREQKAFWVFNYANIVGLFAGLFVARLVTEQLPWLPGPLLIPAMMLAGLSLTWQRQGRETYKTWWLYARYIYRRLFASPSLVLHSIEHYRVEQSGIRPFSIARRMAYSGDRAVWVAEKSPSRTGLPRLAGDLGPRELPSGAAERVALPEPAPEEETKEG
jgi:hypothetical protein